MLYQAETLQDGHDVSSFDSGKPELDMWLRSSARHAASAGTCQTTVWHRESVVVAYYGLTAHVVEKDRVPRGVGHGSPEQIPAILLARLALDKTLHGRGLGSVLLADSFVKIAGVAGKVGIRLVVVDAIDEDAAGFYRKHGFKDTPVPGRLVRKMSSISRDLGLG